ncbi:hypothetical protein PMIN01_00961 [Paraphaeosphaeria minitans]|uniref:SnoaL-like domain-containing protein n=1 Tax=Paraphaeosphaeria minitans TaxID=565426 RepID=A0A9P6GT63_9PLEO|nr:hypothetical protein PMIN01_00961 [Paraphaeosphaeria minitans]
MSTGIPNVAANLDLQTKDVKTAPGVSLNENQVTVLRSVLDLFAGKPSLPKLALWRDDATFTDPITVAEGRDRFAAQWYGLQAAFSDIERLHHEVTDAGNPILMDLKTRYVIKGIGKEQTIASVVAVHLDEQGKIKKVEDKWDGKLPEGSIANVSSVFDLLRPMWWVKYWIAWAFWLWSLTWETRVWRVGVLLVLRSSMVHEKNANADSDTQAFRHLNAVTVPKFVSVPKNADEDAKKGN